MDTPASLPGAIVLAVAVLAVFLSYLVVLKYTVQDNFHRTRLSMTSFFFFIVVTLSLSFWGYTLATLPYAVPACAIGLVLGYWVGVRGAQERLRKEGHAHYREHFAHVHVRGLRDVTWWTFLNFYTIMGALVLINLVGFSTVLMPSESLAIATSTVGALLLGTIAPYLLHLWSISRR
jgi:small basic protein